MRADKYLTLDGKEAVLVGGDNKLPSLDASNLFNLERTLYGKIIEILKVMPSPPFNEDDIGRYVLYSGVSGQYESNSIYRLAYSSGNYSFVKVSDSDDIIGLPEVSVLDNGKILGVSSGKWVVAASPISATSNNVKVALGISASGGALKFLNQKGAFVDAPKELPAVGLSDENKILMVSGGVWNKGFLPSSLPGVTFLDNNKILTVVNGVWEKGFIPSQLPSVEVSDNNKILTVINGVWEKGILPSSLPEVSVLDNDKVLSVVDGVWAKSVMPHSISDFQLTRPIFDDVLHLVVEYAYLNDFSDASVIVDTGNDSSSRERVLVSTGGYFTICPDSGMGGIFSNKTVVVDLSGIELPVNIRYKWTYADGDSDWYLTRFPVSSEAPSITNVNDVLGINPYGGSGARFLTERGEFASPISKMVLSCPEFDDVMHFEMRVSENDDFSGHVVLVDTMNGVGLSRARVFNGSVFTEVTTDGFNPVFSGKTLKIDMGWYNGVNVLYRWSSADGSSDWYATFFPSSGETCVSRQ